MEVVNSRGLALQPSRKAAASLLEALKGGRRQPPHGRGSNPGFKVH
jgi:hypothetical protein